MAIPRRTLLSVAFVGTRAAFAAPDDAVRAERSLGSPNARLTATEFFSLTCPHCAAFALQTLPELKTKWIEPGKLRFVFFDFPTDQTALQAAMVARYVPLEQYERFINVLYERQSHWAFGGGNVADTLWPLASEAGMDHATFERSLGDTSLKEWIVGRALDAQSRWHVSATPSFMINGKLYTGAISAGEFAIILGS
jgi:protein-disulfide isomerase